MGYLFNTTAHWQSGSKDDTTDDSDRLNVTADHLALATKFWDNFNPRKSGYTDDTDSGCTISVGSYESENQLKILKAYYDRFSHTERAYDSDYTNIVNYITLEIPADQGAVEATPLFMPCVAFYWDVDNWMRVVVRKTGTNTFVFQGQVNEAGIMTTDDTCTFSFATGDRVTISFQLLDILPPIWGVWYGFNKGTGWTMLQQSSDLSTGTDEPSKLIFGCGYSFDPTYPNADFDNSGAGSADADLYTWWGKLTLGPTLTSGNWKTPPIAPSYTNQELASLDISLANGTSGNSGCYQVEILNDPGGSVIATWTGDEYTDFSLDSGDFDNPLSVTLGIDYCVVIYLYDDVQDGIELVSLALNVNFYDAPPESVSVSDSLAATHEFDPEESLSVSDSESSEHDIAPEETVTVSDSAPTETEATLPDSLSVSDEVAADYDVPAPDSITVSDEVASDFTGVESDSIAFSDAIDATFEAVPEETVTVSDSIDSTFVAVPEDGFSFSDDAYYLADVLAGIEGYVSAPLDLTSADFCASVTESGHVVVKTSVTPSVDFQAFLFQKQGRQQMDFGIQTFPGDAVMFFCPTLSVSLAVGDTLSHNGNSYTILGIRDKLHGTNIIYKKAFLRLYRDYEDNLPVLDGLRTTINDDGSVLLNWIQIDTLAFPSFSKYRVYISKIEEIALTPLASPVSLPTGRGMGCAFSPDGNYLVVSHLTSPNLTIYDTETWLTVTVQPPTFLYPWSNYGRGVSFSPDGQYFSFGSYYGPSGTIYKKTPGSTYEWTEVSSYALGLSGPCFWTAWDATGTYVAFAGTGGVRIYSWADDTPTFIIALPGSGQCMAGEFSPDGKHIAVITVSGTIYIYNVPDFTLVSAITPLAGWYNYAVKWSSSGRHLFVGCGWGNKIMLFSFDGSIIKQIDHTLAYIPGTYALSFALGKYDAMLVVGTNVPGHLINYLNKDFERLDLEEDIALAASDVEYQIAISPDYSKLVCLLFASPYFQIYAITGGPEDQQIYRETTTPTLNVTGLNPRQSYLFRVSVVTETGIEGPLSDIVSCSADLNNALATPLITNLRAEGGSGRIDLEWDDLRESYLSPIDYYEVWYDKTGATWDLAHTSTSNTSTIDLLTAGTWRVRVRGIMKNRDYTPFATVTGITVT